MAGAVKTQFFFTYCLHFGGIPVLCMDLFEGKI